MIMLTFCDYVIQLNVSVVVVTTADDANRNM